MPKFLIETNQGTFEIESNREPTVEEVEQFASQSQSSSAPKKPKAEQEPRMVRNPFTGELRPVPVVGPDLSDTPTGAALASGLAEIPAIASGTAAFGAAAGNPAVQAMGPWGRVGIPLGAALVGGIGGAIATRPTMERAIPQLAELQGEFPNASALGANIAQAPFFGVGGGARLAERGLGAVLGGGVQLGSELAGDAPLGSDTALRTLMATAGGAAFVNPTKLGSDVIEAGASAGRITSRLSNASTKPNLPSGQAAANEIALAPVPEPPALPVPQPDPMSQILLEGSQGGLPQVVGGPPAVAGEGLGDMSFPDRSRKPTLSEPLDETYTQPVEVAPRRKPRLMPEVITGEALPPNPESQAAIQTAFNNRVKKVIENLAEQGVELDRQTALKLAKITDTREFNLARQKLIDSVGGEITEVPKKGPIKDLKDLPSLDKPEAGSPAKAPPTEQPTQAEVAPAVSETGEQVLKIGTAEYVKVGGEWYRGTGQKVEEGPILKVLEANAPKVAKTEAPEVMAARLSSEADPASLQKDVARYNEIEQMQVEALKAKDMEKINSLLGGPLAAEREAIKNRYGGMPPVAPETSVPAPIKPSKAPVAAKTPEVAPKPAKAKETGIEAAIKRRNIEPDGRLISGGVGEDATPENVAAYVARAEANMRERQALVAKLEAAKAANPNASVPIIRRLLPSDSGVRSWDEAISQQQPLIAATKQYIEDVKAAGRAYKPKAKETPKAARVDVDDLDAIEAEAAKQAAKSAPAKEAPPIKTSFLERAKVKVGKNEVTIGKDAAGDWYGPDGTKLSGGSKQVAIENLKKSLAPKKGVQSAGEKGIVYNPFESGAAAQKLSQIQRLEYRAMGDGSYQVEGFTKTGVRTGRPAKYGRAEVPFVRFEGDETRMREILGDAVADKIVRDTNAKIFEDIPEGRGIGPTEILATGKIEGLSSADFKSKFGTEAGSVINPFENLGQPTEIGRRALEAANEPLLQKMAQADVEASRQGDTFAKFAGNPLEEPRRPEVEFPKPGEGRAPDKETLAFNKQVRDFESNLKPITDSITGNEIPENIAFNAKLIHDKLVADAKVNKAEPPSREVATEIAKDEYYRPGLSDLASRFPILGKIPGGNTLSKAVGTFSRGARTALGTVIGNVRSASSRIAGAIRQKIQEQNAMRIDFISRADELGKLARESLSPQEFNQLDVANLSGDRAAAEAIFKGKSNESDLLASYDAHQQVMGEALALERELGRDVGEVQTYFRRIVRDRDGLLRALGSDGESTYRDLIKDAKTQEEKDLILNNYIAGSMRNRGGKGWLKPRILETIEENLLKFYEPFDVSTHDYIMSVTRDISNRRYFGKTSDDGLPFEGNFGRLIREETESGSLGRKGFDLVNKNLRDYLTNSNQYDIELNKWANRLRKVQTYAYLADVGSAIIQGGEFFTMAWKYGFGNSLKALGGAKKFGLEDIKIYEGGNQDMVSLRRGRGDEGALGKIVHGAEAVYQKAMREFIGRADQFMTGATANAAWRWASDVVRNPKSVQFERLNDTYSKAFPERWPKILDALRSDDFRNGKLNEDSSFFLFNEVANVKPIDAGDRAQGYNASNPFVKLLYSLRTYPIKQLDVMRESAYEALKRGDKIEAFKNLIGYMVVVGAGQQAMNFVRDKAFNRDTEWQEYGITGMLQLAMIPRYAFYRAKEASLPDAVLDTVIPGLGFSRDVWKDLQTTAKFVTGQRDSDGAKTVRDLEDFFKQSRMIQYLPGAGRPIYWWAGRGAESEKKAERDRLEGRQRPSTVQMISEMLVPPDLQAPRR